MLVFMLMVDHNRLFLLFGRLLKYKVIDYFSFSITLFNNNFCNWLEGNFLLLFT